MIRITYAVRGGHTHLEVRSGRRPCSLALSGDFILENGDAEDLLQTLRHATEHGIHPDDLELVDRDRT